MRTIFYKCDRCGKEMTGRSAIKMAVNLQRGIQPVEKISHDFCQACFLELKAGFTKALSDIKQSDANPVIRTEPAAGPATGETSMVKPEAEKPENASGTYTALREGAIVTGPLSKADRKFVLKLHVEKGLDAAEIAERMHRTPKGIKHLLTCAAKSGELNELREEFAGKNGNAQPAEPESEAPVSPDDCEFSSKMEYVNGKLYDVGSILALAKARWSAKDIAGDKHYDEDVVRMLLEKYGK